MDWIDKVDENMVKKNKVKVLYFYVLLCLIFSFLFIGIYKYDNEKIDKINISENVIYDVSGFYYGIDPIVINDENLIITGWIVPQGKDLEYVNRSVVLVNSRNEFYEINTIAYDRDLTLFFDTGYNYDLGGIHAECLIKKLETGEYNVGFISREASGKEYYFDLNTKIQIG